jgi:predicted DNA-binding protein (MmcQ/YjbR family)
MNVEWVREHCLSFPHTTEQIQWGDALVFKVAGKIHVVTSLQPSKVWLTFKVTPENFAELTERPGIIPAPYLARAKWVGLETKDALPLDELASLLRESYDLVFAKLPKKTREALSSGKRSKTSRSKKKSMKRVPPKRHRKSKKPPR